MVTGAGETAGSGLRLLIPARQKAEAMAGGAGAAVARNTLGEMIEAVRSDETAEALNEAGTKEAGMGPSIDSIDGAWHAKEAIEIAAAGQHPIVLAGDQHAGQTLLARCLGGLLGSPDENERNSVLAIHSAAGLLDPTGRDWPQRPIRIPHPSTTVRTLTGMLEQLSDPGS